MFDAISTAGGVGGEAVRRAFMLSGRLPETASAALRGGEQALAGFGLELGRPVRPMLASPAQSLADALAELERWVLLSVLDRHWREHLYEMDYLRDGISLRAYAQRDPLVEYQREGFAMFTTMLDAVKEEAVGFDRE